MRRTRLALPIGLLLTSLLIGPMAASANGSESIPPVMPIYQGQAAPYTGLLFPEAAARANDALTEAAIAKAALYEQRLGEISMLLDVTEAQLAVAKDSLQNLRDLVPRVQAESYRKGFKTGRMGFGAFGGYDPFDREFTAGVGVVYRF